MWGLVSVGFIKWGFNSLGIVRFLLVFVVFVIGGLKIFFNFGKGFCLKDVFIFMEIWRFVEVNDCLRIKFGL